MMRKEEVVVVVKKAQERGGRLITSGIHCQAEELANLHRVCLLLALLILIFTSMSTGE